MSDETFDAVIKRLRKQGRDDSSVEVKECGRKLSKDVWESISAFANTEGGLLILGVSESKGFVPVEGFELDAVRDQFLSGMGDGGVKGRLTNPPRYSIERRELDGEPVMLVRIDELVASRKPCYITERGVQGGSYKRIDDADIALSANEIYALANACAVTASDRESVTDACVSDLDEAIYSLTFAKAAQIMPRALKGAETTEEKLKRLNFIDSVGGATKAGLLCAGAYPQQFFPKLNVDVAVHPGLEKSMVSAVRFADRVICEGTIGEMVESSVLAVVKNLRTVSSVKELGRVDEPEIPVAVLREAVANALIHRDYDARFDGESVSIDVYPDRIEITNPGGLWGGKSRSNLADGRSCCRNATLMKLMSIVPLPSGAGSPAEGNGSGIPLMINECVERGLRSPEFRPAIDHFKVVVFRSNKSDKVSDSHCKGAGADDERLLCDLLSQYGELSIRELGQRSNLSVNQARARVRKLLDAGAVEPTAPATSRNRKYRLRKA